MTSESDPCARAAFFIIRAHKTSIPGDPRVGFVATKRTFKLAVQRNRAKRMLRDWVRFHSDMMLSEYDYIFIARPSILGATRDMGRDALGRALQHISRKYASKKKKNVKQNS